ncbi:MAG: lactate utilization protein [Thermoflexales bacterium]|nr:lactate utilization protein [Thermoflexales bacterium]
MTMNTAREEMLGKVRSALKRTVDSDVAAIPTTARVEPRRAGDSEAELSAFFGEVEKLGGKTRRITELADLHEALKELVKAEEVKKATVWQTAELKAWGVEDALRSFGVEIVSPYAPNREVAECELGITGADFALPETGTLGLRSTIEQPRTVSLLPRVHLSLIQKSCLRVDLQPIFEEAKYDDYLVFVTGPSRTADIELTVTVGVHGPKTLYVWSVP